MRPCLFCELNYLGGKTPDVNARQYSDVMREQLVRAEEREVMSEIQFPHTI